MTLVAFFGHDSGDAAVRRRVQGFRDDGLEVIGFMMRRSDAVAPEWDNIDLGRTFDAAYAQRIRSIFSGARRAAAAHDRLAKADVIYARNLDMLAVAFETKRRAGLKTPVIYESLDVHRLLTRSDPIGWSFRAIERALLSRTRRLVVSSPAFLIHHFERRHAGRYKPVLVENRLAAGASYGPRPTSRPARDATAPLRLGWMGVLRCSRSLKLILSAADQMGDALEVHLHGAPALTEIPDFHERIAGKRNVSFHGRYRAPEDLRRIYEMVDVVWAGDFMEAGFNSLWLLPNRLYEGGYYAAPPIAPAGTQTAKWAEDRGVGFSVPEPLETALAKLLGELRDDPSLIEMKRANLLLLPEETFVQPHGVLKALIESAIAAP